jgi:hypothetical protein
MELCIFWATAGKAEKKKTAANKTLWNLAILTGGKNIFFINESSVIKCKMLVCNKQHLKDSTSFNKIDHRIAKLKPGNKSLSMVWINC